jgi:hypothetical protein
MATEFAGVYPGDQTCANPTVFGVYPAWHFVDYANLEQVDARFKRQYPDEKEALGVGAADPDSLALVARLQLKDGSRPVVTEMLLRDPMKPTHVLAIEGSIDALDEEIGAGWELLQRDKVAADAASRQHGVPPPTPPGIPSDSKLRIPPGVPLALTRNGQRLASPARTPLDYTLPLFPAKPPKP